MTEPIFGRARLRDFTLDPGKIHLNHGSYGAVPRALSEAQNDWRAQIEANPSGFFRGRLNDLLRRGAARVAESFGGRGEDWVFVENATQGANAAIDALGLARGLAPGDHVLATSEVYNAVRQALRHRAGRHGVEIEEVALALPLAGPDTVVAAIEQAIRPTTRAIFADHITSRAALVLPIDRIAALARAHGIACFIDGAHAPGQVEIDVQAIGADWYVGNAHKWLCGPRGAAMLWTAPQQQAAIHPVVISHGYGSGYTAEFDWIGTRDVTAWLTVPAALDWHDAQGGAAFRARSRALARAMGERLAEAFGTETSGTPEMTAAMAAVRLPGPASQVGDVRAMAIDRDHDAVVAVSGIQGADWLRVSAAIYNDLEDVDRIIQALT